MTQEFPDPCVCFFVSRATSGSKSYVSPLFWRWSAPSPSWSLWVEGYALQSTDSTQAPHTQPTFLNAHHRSIPGTIIQKAYHNRHMLTHPFSLQEILWLYATYKKIMMRQSRLKLSLLDRWFCPPSEISSSLYFSIVGWPNTLWRTW